jgi:aconitate hydratase
VVTDYLERSGLTPYLEKLGFNLVGYGCTTCIGNSGPLPEAVAHEIEDKNLACVAVLSGNRNFEGRIHPQVKASYLASPLLVVAYALAGTVNIDLSKDALGKDQSGDDVFLSDLWPTKEELSQALSSVQGEMFAKEYSRIFEGDENWKGLPSPTGGLFAWDPESTYVREAPFFPETRASAPDIRGARVLALLGDSITTDHISPAGNIAFNSPAGAYLREHGVDSADFNTYGARRGNHEVMIRGTFANIRLRNQLAQGKEGGFTEHIPTGQITTVYEASLKYQSELTPLIVIAGKEYGSGSSRDWAAKGPLLLGVKAVIAESFERIHRSNLVGMGVLPLQFVDGENATTLGLTGREEYSIASSQNTGVHQIVEVTAKTDGGETKFKVMARIDSETDVEYMKSTGILPMVLAGL